MRRRLLAGGAVPVIAWDPFDAIAVSVAGGGRYAGLAPCGDALTSLQVAALGSLAGLRATGAVVALDPIRAKSTWAVRAYDLLRTVTGKVMGTVFPAGGGPATLLETSGPAVLATVLRDTARPLAHLVAGAHLDAWASRLADPAGRGRALRDVAAMIIAMAPPQATAHAQQPKAEGGLGAGAGDGRPLANCRRPRGCSRPVPPA